jgi:hypothetical protein
MENKGVTLLSPQQKKLNPDDSTAQAWLRATLTRHA